MTKLNEAYPHLRQCDSPFPCGCTCVCLVYVLSNLQIPPFDRIPSTAGTSPPFSLLYPNTVIYRSCLTGGKTVCVYTRICVFIWRLSVFISGWGLYILE
jgi:hypothetical protein